MIFNKKFLSLRIDKFIDTYYYKDRKGATDSWLALVIITTQRSNHTLQSGGYFFVFRIISNINITMILSIIRMIANIS